MNYFALALIIFVFLVLFYGLIIVHDIPYIIAQKREHPHQDAIHVAGWVSMFTLHAIWPLLWIWSMLYKPDRGWGMSSPQDTALLNQLQQLQQRVEKLEQRKEN